MRVYKPHLRIPFECTSQENSLEASASSLHLNNICDNSARMCESSSRFSHDLPNAENRSTQEPLSPVIGESVAHCSRDYTRRRHLIPSLSLSDPNNKQVQKSFGLQVNRTGPLLSSSNNQLTKRFPSHFDQTRETLNQTEKCLVLIGSFASFREDSSEKENELPTPDLALQLSPIIRRNMKRKWFNSINVSDCSSSDESNAAVENLTCLDYSQNHQLESLTITSCNEEDINYTHCLPLKKRKYTEEMQLPVTAVTPEKQQPALINEENLFADELIHDDDDMNQSHDIKIESLHSPLKTSTNGELRNLLEDCNDETDSSDEDNVSSWNIEPVYSQSGSVVQPDNSAWTDRVVSLPSEKKYVNNTLKGYLRKVIGQMNNSIKIWELERLKFPSTVSIRCTSKMFFLECLRVFTKHGSKIMECMLHESNDMVFVDLGINESRNIIFEKGRKYELFPPYRTTEMTFEGKTLPFYFDILRIRQI